MYVRRYVCVDLGTVGRGFREFRESLLFFALFTNNYYIKIQSVY